MYKEDLALINLQWLICHKIQPNQILFFYSHIYLTCFLIYFHSLIFSKISFISQVHSWTFTSVVPVKLSFTMWNFLSPTNNKVVLFLWKCGQFPLANFQRPALMLLKLPPLPWLCLVLCLSTQGPQTLLHPV